MQITKAVNKILLLYSISLITVSIKQVNKKQSGKQIFY